MNYEKSSTLVPGTNTTQKFDEVEVVDDESKRRMKSISSSQMARMYGRGFKLLQKAGFNPNEEENTTAPIKVLLRKPREGLQDDEVAGRKALGESAAVDISDYMSQLSNVREFIEAEGGSASLHRVYAKVIKPHIASPSIVELSRALTSAGKENGIKIVGEVSADAQVVLIRPPASTGPRFQTIACTCTAPGARYPVSFSRTNDWAWHVFDRFEFGHEEYEMRLMRMSEGWGLFHCLQCHRPFPDLVRVVKHCRAMPDQHHRLFGTIVLGVLLERADSLTPQGQLMLLAVQEGDVEFEWGKIFSDFVIKHDIEIPFEECPPTPIALSDDEDVVEIVDVADEDTSSDHDMHGIINLED